MGFEKYLRDTGGAENTIESYVRDVSLFTDFMNGAAVSAATEKDIERCMEQMERDGKSAATINRFLAALRTYYSYLQEQGDVTANPAAGVKYKPAKKPPPEFLTVEEMADLLKQPANADCPEVGIRDRAILELLYATGMRVSELLDLNVEDVNLTDQIVTVADRVIPLHNEAVVALEEWLYVREADNNILFVNQAGERMTRQNLWKRLRKYGEEAGIEKEVSPKTLSHTFAVHMIEGGAGVETVQNLMGHASAGTTRIYEKLITQKVYAAAHPRARKQGPKRERESWQTMVQHKKAAP